MDQLESSSYTLEERGKHIYKSNKHLRRIGKLMENPEFREFVNEYMDNLDELKSMIMFIKLYQAIEKHSQNELSPCQKIAILQDAITNGKIRQEICNGMHRWLNGETTFALNDTNRNCTELRIVPK